MKTLNVAKTCGIVGTILTFLFVLVLTASCNSGTDSVPEPRYDPGRTIPPARLIFSWGLPDEAYYLPGETVEVKLLFKNVSSNNVTLEYLPEIRVAKHLSGGQALYSWTGRELMTELKPDETTTIDFTWDQKDTNGKQVPPGWYYITYKDPNVTGSLSGISIAGGAFTRNHTPPPISTTPRTSKPI